MLKLSEKSSSEATQDELYLLLVDHEGKEHRLEAIEGWRVMEVIRDWGFPIKAECGGACACATCHVYIDEDWVARLPRPSDEEVDRLDEAFMVQDNSRLSCQLLMSPEINGLKVRLAPGTE